MPKEVLKRNNYVLFRVLYFIVYSKRISILIHTSNKKIKTTKVLEGY